LSSVEAHWQVGDSVALAQIRRSLTANALFRVLVPDCDRHGRAIPQLELLSLVERALIRINGGFTRLSGGPRNGGWTYAEASETTVVVESYLPEEVSEATQDALLLVVESLGRAADQRELLFADGIRCYRVHFEEDEIAMAKGWELLRELAGTKSTPEPPLAGKDFEYLDPMAEPEVKLMSG
jgi:hypothetical protein